MGWRYQIPDIINMGLRVVAPDCLGYGRTVRAWLILLLRYYIYITVYQCV